MDTKAWMDNLDVERLENLREQFKVFEEFIVCNNVDHGPDAEETRARATFEEVAAH